MRVKCALGGIQRDRKEGTEKSTEYVSNKSYNNYREIWTRRLGLSEIQKRQCRNISAKPSDLLAVAEASVSNSRSLRTCER